MEIRFEDRSMLVFNAYRHYELVSCGNRLRIGELQDRWCYSGLRQADLALTLDELTGRGILRAESTPSGTAYYITERGAAHIRNHPETPASCLALHQLARRPRTSSPLRLERRAAA